MREWREWRECGLLTKGEGLSILYFIERSMKLRISGFPNRWERPLSVFLTKRCSLRQKNHRKSMAMTCFVGLFTICTMKNKLTFGVSESTSFRRDERLPTTRQRTIDGRALSQ